MSAQKIIRFYYSTYKLVPSTYRLLISFHSLLRAFFSGIWLGLLGRETLLGIDNTYYSTTNKYSDRTYNRSGLRPWETAMVERFFKNCKVLLVVGAGGGREILALKQLSYEVHGVECNPELVRAANTLLEEEGLLPTVQYSPPDSCPSDHVKYDGLIVGWGAYMLIQGRAKRIALLRSMRAQVHTGAPLLLSFFFRSTAAKRFIITMAVGNALRRLQGREKLELGDALEPEFVHYMTQEEVTAEMQEGGFAIEYYSENQYGHAVGIAV